MKWYEDTKTLHKTLMVAYKESLKHDYNKVQEYLMDIENLLNKIRNEKHELKTAIGKGSVINITTEIYDLQEQSRKLLAKIDENIKEFSENV